MTETLSVLLSGTSLSLLLYETMKSPYGQEGFLLGELIEHKTTTITDNDQQQENIARKIKINGAFPCPFSGYFYDGVGRLDERKLDEMLLCLRSTVVAWYRYGLNFKFTSRDKRLHHQLADYFKISPKFFMCCLLNSGKSDNGSTHSFSQSFVRLSDRVFDQIPMHIVNLSDSNNTYKLSETQSETFCKIIKDLKVDCEKSQSSTVITNVQNQLHKHVNCLIDESSKEEERLFQLENEVRELCRKKFNVFCDNSESHLEVAKKAPKGGKGRRGRKRN